MKRLIISIALAATALAPVQVLADPPPGHGWKKHEKHEEKRAREEYKREHHDMRDWHKFRDYDWNRPEPGHSHYNPAIYYRVDTSYKPIVVTRETRIYRGDDGRYYCRRSDGTTGLIVGAATGAVLGNMITKGDSKVLGTIIGAATGGMIGKSIDSGNMVCR